VIAQALPWVALAVFLALTAAAVIWSDQRTHTPPDTTLADEISRRSATLRESHEATNRALIELHARGEQLASSIAKRGLSGWGVRS